MNDDDVHVDDEDVDMNGDDIYMDDEDVDMNCDDVDMNGGDVYIPQQLARSLGMLLHSYKLASHLTMNMILIMF